MAIRKLIHVTQDDINTGDCGDTFSCPIALAIKRELNINKVKVGVGSTYNLYQNVETGETSILPRRAKKFITAFDAGWDVEPFNFYLTLGDAKTNNV